MIKLFAMLAISTNVYAGYIKGTVGETDEGFDFWVEINSDFLGETIKSHFAEPDGLPSVDKCSVGKLDFDVVHQSFYFRGSCFKKRSSEIKKLQEQTP